jgi:hypothetical protein
MSVCHRDILSSRSTAGLLKPMGYGSHCREGVNGNPVLALDYFSLLERFAQSFVRSIASPFDYARVPSCEGTGPHRGLFTYLPTNGSRYSACCSRITACGTPVHAQRYRAGSHAPVAEKTEIYRMLAQQVIGPATCEWAQPIVLVPIPDGALRFAWIAGV